MAADCCAARFRSGLGQLRVIAGCARNVRVGSALPLAPEMQVARRHFAFVPKPDIGFTNFLHRWRPFQAVSAACFDWQSRHVDLIVRCRRPVRFLVRALRRRISDSEYSTVWSWIEAASPDQLNLARFGGRRWIALTARARVSLRRIEHAEGSTTVYFSPTMPRQRLVPMQARLEAGACLCVK